MIVLDAVVSCDRCNRRKEVPNVRSVSEVRASIAAQGWKPKTVATVEPDLCPTCAKDPRQMDLPKTKE